MKVLPTYDASKVTASGPGLSSYGIPASLPVEFAVDAKDAGQGLLAVQITVSNCIAKHEQKHVVVGGQWIPLEVRTAVPQHPQRPGDGAAGGSWSCGTGKSCTLCLRSSWGCFYETAVLKSSARLHLALG